MKFEVMMKDPDTLHDAIREAVTEEVSAITSLSDGERDGVIDTRCEAVSKLCKRWFEYSEYLTVEIDTEAKKCVVVTR